MLLLPYCCGVCACTRAKKWVELGNWARHMHRAAVQSCRSLGFTRTCLGGWVKVQRPAYCMASGHEPLPTIPGCSPSWPSC